MGPIEAETVRARVGDARRRLTDSEARGLVWQAIEAHGGLERWLAAGTLPFELDYAPIGRKAHRKHTRNQVDLWRARARQEEVGEGAEAVLGWDGERAWIAPEQREVDGLVFAHRYDTYGRDDEEGPGKRITGVTARDIRLGETWPASIFDPPEGAVVLDSIAPHVD